MKSLVSFESCPVNECDSTGYTPLSLAVYFRSSAIVRALLTSTHAENIDVNTGVAIGDVRCTPLHLACIHGDIGIVRDLLATWRARINAKAYKQYTPLHMACISSQTEVVALLASLESCDVNAQAYEGNTPLHLAVELCGNIDTARVLMSCNRIKPSTRNSHGFTPLDVARMLGKEPITELLLSHWN